jgi:hypothetical protein
MLRSEISERFRLIESIISDTDRFVDPELTSFQAIRFRANVGNLCIVSFVSSYENCIKDIMVEFAEKRDSLFGHFVRNRFQRINGQIKIEKLREYSGQFGGNVRSDFIGRLDAIRSRVSRSSQQDICRVYDDLISRRHAIVHGGASPVTIEEATRMHNLSKRVVFAFAAALHSQKSAV